MLRTCRGRCSRPRVRCGGAFDEGSAAFVPGATYLIPNNIEGYKDGTDDEDDKGEHLTDSLSYA